MKHIPSSHNRYALPWSATIYCTIDPQLIYHRPPCDCVCSSSRSKHTRAILYEVGRICLGNSLNPLTRGLYQLTYLKRGTYAGIFSVILQCESHIWQCSHLNSNLPCNMVFKGCLGPCLMIIFSDTLIVIWPLFSCVCQENAGMPIMLQE